MVDKESLMSSLFTGTENITKEETRNIYLDKLKTFHTGEYEHVFSVEEDADMISLMEDIKDNGVLEPILVRPDSEDKYEIIAGHRRVYASRKLGLEKIKAVILDYDDDTAIKVMILTNLKKRSEIKPSEKAFAYKTYMEANKRQGLRTDIVKEEKGAGSELSEKLNESKQNIYRTIKLTKLIPQFLQLVDDKTIKLSAGINLSYISEDIQNKIYEIIKIRSYSITTLKSNELKEQYIKNGLNNLTDIENIFKAEDNDNIKNNEKNEKISIDFLNDVLPSYIQERTSSEKLEYLKKVIELQKQTEEYMKNVNA